MIDELLDKMTLEEQVALLSGEDFWTTPAIERVGVPKVKVTDGPNGARGGGSLVGGVKAACFPCAITLGAGWNPALVREIGAALADEAKSKSASVLLAPTVNIHRSGLNGRNFECYSEDPHLTAELAVAYIEGVQSKGIAATIKHFAANDSEVERQTMSSDVDERTLREIYLPPFEAAVKRAGVMAVMSSYNRVNGTYASENPWLLTQALREEWGFDGVVMSDWFGSHSTAESVNAGLDLEMPGPTRDRGDKLVQAVKDGKVKPATIREAARRVLTLFEKIGIFAEGYALHEERAEDRPEHRALIRKAAADGAVLLKNDGILPLEKTALDRIAVLGANAAEARVMGGGSAQINAHYKVSPLQGIRNALSGTNSVAHVPGVQNNRLTQMFSGPLVAEFYAGKTLSGPVIWQQESANGEFMWFDLPPHVDKLDFSVRITGSYTAEADGEHVFGMTTAGLGSLYVDGERVVNCDDGWKKGDNFFGLGNSEVRGTKKLETGRTYALRIDFRTLDAAFEGIDFSALRFGVELPLGDAAIADAVARARECDVAIVFAGREGEWDTEGRDLPDLTLPGRQDELIAAVAAANPRTIVVLQTGGPIAMPWLADVAAVLEMWYPGQELGNAVADVLFGDVTPGGRLPQTFPKALSDNSAFTADPLSYPGVDGHVVYKEGVFVGYRHHDTRGIAPLFPFGFGLSYTRFAWSGAKASATTSPEGRASVTVTIKNIGARTGSELVQLYVRPLSPSVERPDKELRAFAKVELAPGEVKTVTLSVASRDFAFFDVAAKAFVAEAGRYELVLAANAADIRWTGEIALPATITEPVGR